jgi:hypothetical protein
MKPCLTLPAVSLLIVVGVVILSCQQGSNSFNQVEAANCLALNLPLSGSAIQKQVSRPSQNTLSVEFTNYKEHAYSSLCSIRLKEDSVISLTSFCNIPLSAIARISEDNRYLFGIIANKVNGEIQCPCSYSLWCSSVNNPMAVVDTIEINPASIQSGIIGDLVVLPGSRYKLLVFVQLYDETPEAPILSIEFDPVLGRFSKSSNILPNNSALGFADYRVHESASGINSGGNCLFWVGPQGIPTIWTPFTPDWRNLSECGGNILSRREFLNLAKSSDVHGLPKCDVSPDCRFCIVSLAHESNGLVYLALWDLKENKCAWFDSFKFVSCGETSGYWIGVPLCFSEKRRFVVCVPGLIRQFEVAETRWGPIVTELPAMARPKNQPVFCSLLKSDDGKHASIVVMGSSGAARSGVNMEIYNIKE